MWRFLLFFGLLFCLTRPAKATVTLVQVKSCTVATQSSCAVSITSTAAGNFIGAGWVSGAAGANVITAVTAGACSVAWVHTSLASVGASGDGSVDLFHCLKAAGGTVSITVTATSANAGSFAVIWEAHTSLSGGTWTVDSGGTPSQTKTDTTCTACAGVALSLSGNNKFIIGLAACGGTCSALVGTGFTNDLANPSNDGVMHGITASSGTVTSPTTWTQTSGTLVCDAAAFQENAGAGGAATMPVAVY